MGQPVTQPRWRLPALTRARAERERETAHLTAELGTLRGWADQAQTWIAWAEGEITGLRAALREAEDDRACAHDELERVGGTWLAARTRAGELMRALLGPRYAHIAAHAPRLLTDERDVALGWQPSDRHARVAAHECGFVADECPALLDRLAADPHGRYALLWAGLWAPSERAWDTDDHTWVADLLDRRTGEVVECNDATAVLAGWPDLAALHRRPAAPDGPPPPGEMTLAEVREALRLVAAHAAVWTCLAVDPGAAIGRYSLYLEGHGGQGTDGARGYDFPCMSLDECRAVLGAGPDAWESQGRRTRERHADGEHRRAAWQRGEGARTNEGRAQGPWPRCALCRVADEHVILCTPCPDLGRLPTEDPPYEPEWIHPGLCPTTGTGVGEGEDR